MKLRVASCKKRRLPNGAAGENPPYGLRSAAFAKAFTLIEIMVVVAIIGVVLATGAPTLYRFMHKEGFRKSVGELMDACRTARERAIMGQQTTTLVLQPDQFHVQSAGGHGWGGDVVEGHFPNDVLIESLRINGADAMSLGLTEIQFFQNGTSDEMELVLLNNKTGERRKLTLELTTALVSLQMDPNRWR